MPGTLRRGHPDAQQLARLNYLKGSTPGAAPTTVYLAIFASSVPLSDGSGGTEIGPATRPSITFGSISQDTNGRHFMTNSAAINNIVLTNTSPAEIIGYGIYDASTAGNLLYVDQLYPQRVAAGATISIAVGQIKVYSEPPTI